MDRINYYHRSKGMPFLNKTGIGYNVDPTVDALMRDLEDVRKALQKSGLDLVKDYKEMQVIVIRDPQK